MSTRELTTGGPAAVKSSWIVKVISALLPTKTADATESAVGEA
jgi:hypothetical protein